MVGFRSLSFYPVWSPAPSLLLCTSLGAVIHIVIFFCKLQQLAVRSPGDCILISELILINIGQSNIYSVNKVVFLLAVAYFVSTFSYIKAILTWKKQRPTSKSFKHKRIGSCVAMAPVNGSDRLLAGKSRSNTGPRVLVPLLSFYLSS